MKTMKAYRLLTIVSAAFVSSCSTFEYRELGEKAMEAYHQQVDAGAYESVMERASPRLFETRGPNVVRDQLETFYSEVGPCMDGSAVGWRVQNSSKGDSVTIQYARSCQKADIREDLTWEIIRGETWLAEITLAKVKMKQSADTPGGADIL